MATWNATVVRRWVEVATVEEIADAIDIPSPVGTALCMAAAVKKDHEIGNARILECLSHMDDESYPSKNSTNLFSKSIGYSLLTAMIGVTLLKNPQPGVLPEEAAAVVAAESSTGIFWVDAITAQN